jgi:site-specific DNA-methyltransferase (adenine-specific)
MVENGWEGWGKGGLKPSHEPIAFCRKPIEKGLTVAENCLKWGTGGINIDESRVAANWKEERPESWFNSGKSKSGEPTYDGNLKSLTESTVGERLHDGGRFPANLIHDNSEEVRECFPDLGKASKLGNNCKSTGGWSTGLEMSERNKTNDYSDSGSASRFFKSIIYQAKASKSERQKGCEDLYILKDGISEDIKKEIETLLDIAK